MGADNDDFIRVYQSLQNNVHDVGMRRIGAKI
jgi:hypothetical protein